MHVLNEMERPSIKVFTCYNHGRDDSLKQLLYGIEEEGIPYEVLTHSGSTALTLAWEACLDSRLEVGIGLDNELLILHYRKLEADKPLFIIPARAPEEELRALGANAARLVKRLPFKPLKMDLKEVKQ